MHRLVCACVVCKSPKAGFLAARPILSTTHCPNFYPINILVSSMYFQAAELVEHNESAGGELIGD